MTHPANSSWEERIAVPWEAAVDRRDPYHWRVYAVMQVDGREVRVMVLEKVPPLVAVHIMEVHNLAME